MSKTALVVDDSATIRQLVGGVLRTLGFVTVEAQNGKEAVDKLKQQVDLVVTDINMPQMDGITFVKLLRENAAMKATPVLMLTTETEQSMKDRARAAGATGWLTKPFAPDQLRAVVARVCP